MRDWVSPRTKGVHGKEHTLLQPGNSQACTRLPFFALLIRWVVGVYVMGRGISAFGLRRALLLRSTMVTVEVRLGSGD